MSELPFGWTETTVGELYDFIGGGTPSKAVASYWNGNIPWASIKDISQVKELLSTQDLISDEGLKNSAANVAEIGDVILGTRMLPGKTVISKIRTAINQDLKIVKPKVDIPSSFTAYQFDHLKDEFLSRSGGTTVQGITIDKIKEIPFLLPPLPEQKRIVAKLDTLFAHLDQLKARLEKIPTLLKQFRQAVLTQAVTGKLTENWRKNVGYKEILVDDPIKQKIIGATCWSSMRFSEACKLIGGSQPPKSRFSKAEIDGYVRLIQIRDYKSDDHIVYVPKKEARRFCSKDDIMIGRYGPPIFQILKGLEGAYNVALMKAEPIGEFLDKEYLYYYLQNPLLFQYVDSGSHRTAGQTGVNKEYLENYPFFLPPIEEQKEIVRRVESLFALADRIEASNKTLKEKIDHLPQAILSKAFRGELVGVEHYQEQFDNLPMAAEPQSSL